MSFISHNRPLDPSHGDASSDQQTHRWFKALNQGFKPYPMCTRSKSGGKMGAESCFVKISSDAMWVWSVGQPIFWLFSNTYHWDMIWYQRFRGLMTWRSSKVVICHDFWVRSHVLSKFRVMPCEFEASDSRSFDCFPTHIIGTWSGDDISTGWAVVRGLIKG